MDYGAAIKKLTPYLRIRSDGTLVLENLPDDNLGICGQILSDLERSLAVTNRMIMRGEISAEQVLHNGISSTSIS